MSDFERKDDLPKGQDSPASSGSEPADVDSDFEVVVSDDPPSQSPVAGADGVSGGDDGGDEAPEPAPQQGDEPRTAPRSRAARVRQRLAQERDQAVAVAQHLAQQLQGLQGQAGSLQQRAFLAERDNVENRYHYLSSVQQQAQQAKIAAMNEGRTEEIVRLDGIMQALGPELHQVNQRRQQFANFRPQQQAPQQPQQMPMRQQPAAPPQRLHEAAEKWATTQQAWLEAAPERLDDVRTIAQRLERQGFQPDEPEYYDRLNQGIQALHSDFRPVNPIRGTAQRSAGSAVAGVNRASPDGNRQTRQVALTREDMAFCERNNIDPKSYAREKLAAQQTR